MDKDRYVYISKELAAFNLGTIQDFFTLMLIMDREGIDHSELAIFKELRILEKKKNNQVINLISCPECGSNMSIHNVNVGPRTVTGDDSKIVYTCIDPNCMHQIFE